jgi:hypothetical protein
MLPTTEETLACRLTVIAMVGCLVFSCRFLWIIYCVGHFCVYMICASNWWTQTETYIWWYLVLVMVEERCCFTSNRVNLLSFGPCCSRLGRLDGQSLQIGVAILRCRETVLGRTCCRRANMLRRDMRELWCTSCGDSQSNRKRIASPSPRLLAVKDGPK